MTLYLIIKNLMRKKIRLFLTLLAIFTAFWIFGLLAALDKALNAGVDLAADDRLVVVNKINFTQPLPYAYFNRVRAIEGVDVVAHFNWFGAYYQDARNNFPMFAASPKEMLDVYPELVLSAEERAAFLDNRQALLVGRETAEKYGWHVGDRVPISSNIFSRKEGGQTWEFDIAAIYEAKTSQIDEVSAYFHYEYFNKSRSFGTDYIGFLGVRTSDPALNESVIDAIDAQFANSFFETETVPEKIFNRAFIAQIGNIGLIITSIVGAAFFTSLFVVGNSMVLSVRERVAEIAVLKTIGFSARWIFLSILGESVMVTLFGGGLGLLATYLVADQLNASENLPIPSLSMDLSLVLTAVAVMLLLGVVTGLLPAFNAWRIQIAQALGRRS